MDDVPDQVQPNLPTDPFKEASAKHRPEARLVEEGLPAVVLGAIAGDALQGKVSTAGFKSYLDKLLEDSGSPTDPIERQFVEQLAWAHARVGSLHVQAAHAQSPEQAAALNNAAAKLMNEHRKTGLALREYRSPVVPKQVTVVRQQNVAAGNQNVAMVDGRPQEVAGTNSYTEQGSNQGLLNHVDLTAPIPTADSRPPQPAEVTRSNDRRPEKAATNGFGKPPLAAIDWPANGHG